jgi:hypothetical protein
MKNITVLMAFLLMAFGCSQEDPANSAEPLDLPATGKTETTVEAAADDFDEVAATNRAKKAIMLFAGELQVGFSTALRDEGPVGAIKVCHTEAIAITERISGEMGLNLGRVSLRNRNPGNAPNDWQFSVMQEFEEQHEAGIELAHISWSEVVGEGEDREFRFMKPIPTHDVCLKCHGTNITHAVQQTLDELYPKDMATGFSKGDIRGAFVVTSAVAP